MATVAPGEIGKRIKKARERKGWTQLAFALEANVSPSTVTRWEAGKLPSVRELMRVAELLGVEPDYLVEADEPATPSGGVGGDVAELRQEVARLQDTLAAQRAETLQKLDDIRRLLEQRQSA